MPKREKIKSLFESIIKQTKDSQKSDDRKRTVPVMGIGHVIINSGGNIINVYNGQGR